MLTALVLASADIRPSCEHVKLDPLKSRSQLLTSAELSRDLRLEITRLRVCETCGKTRSALLTIPIRDISRRDDEILRSFSQLRSVMRMSAEREENYVRRVSANTVNFNRI